MSNSQPATEAEAVTSYEVNGVTYTVGDVIKPSKEVAKLLREITKCKDEAAVALEGLYRTILLDQGMVENLVSGFFVDFQEPSHRKNYLSTKISRTLYSELGSFLPIRLDFGTKAKLVVRSLAPGERLDIADDDVLKSLGVVESSGPAKEVAKEFLVGALDIDFELGDKIGEVVFTGDSSVTSLLDFSCIDEEATKNSDLIQKMSTTVRQLFKENPSTPFCLVALNDTSFCLTSVPVSRAPEININALYDVLIQAGTVGDKPPTILTIFTQPGSEDMEPMFSVAITQIIEGQSPLVSSISFNLDTGEFKDFRVASEEQQAAAETANV